MPKHSQAINQESYVPSSVKELLLLMARPYKKRLFSFFFLTFLGVVAWTASPFIISKLINHLSGHHSIDNTAWLLVILYAVLRILDETFWRIGEYVILNFKPQMVESVRTNLFSATLKKPYSFFVNSSSGRIGYWINQTTSTTNELVDTTMWTVWGQALGLIISAAFLFTVHWTLAVLFIVWLILLFWFNLHRGKKFGTLVAVQSDETSKASGIVVDSISNHLSVRAFNAAARERAMLVEQQTVIVTAWRTSWVQNWVTNAVKGQSAAIVSVIALISVLLLYGHGTVQLGGIVLFIAYFGEASSGLWQLAWALDNYFRNFGTLQNALDGLTGEDERRLSIANTTDLPREVELELKNITFAYPEQKKQEVLKSINVHISAGQKVGVVGHSGAGKSTLIGLLLGFYEPTKGSICVNGNDTTEHDPSYVRAISSYVPQDTNLFNRTVKENVLYARPDATEAQLIDALTQAQALGFVKKLPKGIDTVIGERGVKLSGGQRQRIAIARAILQNAPLLLLDEATSALDSVSEQAIQKALSGLMLNRTSLVIAHRLSTLKHLDKIIVLDKGIIAEEGSHDDLILQGGIYADLWQRQKDGFIVE